MASYGAVPVAEARSDGRRAPLVLATTAALLVTLSGGVALRSTLLAEVPATASCPSCRNTETGDLCAPCTADGDCASSALPALQGVDVVSFRSLKSGSECAAAGSADIAADYMGYTWRFATEANRATFVQNPARYVPKYGGFCALGIAAEDTWSKALLGPPVAVASADWCSTAWSIVDDALYVFNANALPAFSPETDIAAADARWAEWFGDGPHPYNTDAWPMRKGECVDSDVGNCCSCDAALGYDCPLAAPALLLGADADDHGCLASAGYAWCASAAACVRAFETPCPDDAAPLKRVTRVRVSYGI